MALALPLHVRHRPVTLVVIVLLVLVSTITAGQTLPSLYQDPTLPRPRLSLAWGCALSACVVLFARPVLPLGELLAGRSMRGARMVLATSLLALLSAGSLVCLLTPQPWLAWRCLTVASALCGLGLVAALYRTFWGLLAPVAYVMAGLGFGYQAELDLGLRVQPWAWLVDPSAPVALELALLSVGLAAFVVRGLAREG